MLNEFPAVFALMKCQNVIKWGEIKLTVRIILRAFYKSRLNKRLNRVNRGTLWVRALCNFFVENFSAKSSTSRRFSRKIEEVMEYCSDFRLVQTTMSHCNEFVKKFDEILYYGGNEAFINETASRLQNIFKNKSHTPDDCHQLRKILLLLMLNTDIALSRDLKEDIHVCHLLNNFPQLSPCLFVNLMWQTKLDVYFYESLKHAPSWFILQFLPEAIDSLRFSKPLDVIAQVKEMTEALYHNICRMDYKPANADQQIERKIIVNKLVDNFIPSLLRNYNTPDGDADIAKFKNKFQEYLGHSTNLQLSLVLNCFEMFLKKPSYAVSEEVKIFKLMAQKEPEVNNFSAATYSPVVHEALFSINMSLLNTLQNSVVNIRLDDFMYWLEIKIEDESTDDEDLKCDNIQKSVGRSSHKLIELINKNETFKHNVVDQLQTMAIKPRTLQELASEATVGTILLKIEQSPNRRVWLEELLNRPTITCRNTECLETLIDAIDIVYFNDLMTILQGIQTCGDLDQEDEKLLKKIFRLAARQLSNFELRDLTEELIRVFGYDYDINSDGSSDAIQTSEITNYFNKLTETDILEDQMWGLIVLNPLKFYESLMKHVVQQDTPQIRIALKILAQTNTVAVEYVGRSIQESLESAASVSKSQYHVFLVGLFKLDLIDRKEYITDVFMGNISVAMSKNASKLVAMLLVSLKQLSAKLKIDDLLVPLAVLLAHVLDKYRWDYESYCQLNETIVENSIEIIQDVVKTILVKGTVADKQFVIGQINDCKPMTKFYYQKFSLEKSDSVCTFDQFLQPNGFDNASKKEITDFLCKTIVCCTSKEFKWLMSNEKLHAFITNALLVFIAIVDSSKKQEAINCLHKCVSDFVKALKDLIIPKLECDNDQFKQLFESVMSLLKAFPNHSFDELTVLFIDVFNAFKSCDDFITQVEQINDCELKRIMLNNQKSSK